ncbi:hypothetical protein [Rickettsia endosymbiont of Oedothorax gibbosus]|nr:hypothetical protein [Rickettsia endosymbiont of Oedothorax gibbosus]
MLKEDYIEGFAMTNCTGLIYQSKVKNRQIELNNSMIGKPLV